MIPFSSRFGPQSPGAKGTGDGAARCGRGQGTCGGKGEVGTRSRGLPKGKGQEGEGKQEGKREEQHHGIQALTPEKRTWLGARESGRWLGAGQTRTRHAHRLSLDVDVVSLWVLASSLRGRRICLGPFLSKIIFYYYV